MQTHVLLTMARETSWMNEIWNHRCDYPLRNWDHIRLCKYLLLKIEFCFPCTKRLQRPQPLEHVDCITCILRKSKRATNRTNKVPRSPRMMARILDEAMAVSCEFSICNSATFEGVVSRVTDSGGAAMGVGGIDVQVYAKIGLQIPTQSFKRSPISIIE